MKFSREFILFSRIAFKDICDPQSLRLRHDLRVSVNEDVNLLFRKGFIFSKLRIREVSGK